MPRPPRIHLAGALYYVTSRAVDERRLFRDERDYQTYLNLMKEIQQTHGIKVFAYVLLPQELHLALELTTAATISAVMHTLNSRYTKGFSKRYGHTGHLFQSRFKSTLMEKAPSLLGLTGYLHTHPVRSGLVSDLGGYQWSSYQSYLAASSGVRHLSEQGQAPRQVPDTARVGGEVQEVLGTLAHRHPGMTYEQYVRSVPAQEWEHLGMALQRGVVGSETFVAQVEQRRKAAAHPPALEPPRPAPQPSGPRRLPSFMLTGSLAVAVVSLCAAGLYAKNLSAIRQAMRAQAQERSSLQVVAAPDPATTESPTARLATFNIPSRLSGTSWSVQIHLAAEEGEVVHKDRLEFRDGKVISQQLSVQGFPASNYTLTVQRDGVVIWETIQTNSAGEIVCWRGEWSGQMMHGVMTRQRPGFAAMNFSFVGGAQPPTGTAGRTTSEI